MTLRSRLLPRPNRHTIPVLLCALCVLAAAAAAAVAGVATMKKWTEEDLLRNGFRLVGEKSDDKFPEIKGLETRIRIYKKDKEVVGIYMFQNGQIYGFARKFGNEPMSAFIDEYNNGFCTKALGDGGEFTVDFKAYGVNIHQQR